MIDWKEIWKGAKYFSETEMWDHLYVECDLGVVSIGKLLGVSAPTISRRLKTLNYEIRSKGGDNRQRIKTYTIIKNILKRRMA